MILGVPIKKVIDKRLILVSMASWVAVVWGLIIGIKNLPRKIRSNPRRAFELLKELGSRFLAFIDQKLSGMEKRRRQGELCWGGVR